MQTLIPFFLFFAVLFLLFIVPYSTTWSMLVAAFVGAMIVLAVIT
jgi:uncharacterized membrane protein YeaQ/YmgE (transglycosylase-associated protein family)